MDNNHTPNSSSATHDSSALEVGARLKLARESRDLTQQGVSTRTKMVDPAGKGISRTSLVAYEQGPSLPGLREIKLLCEVLRISPNWLILGVEESGQIKQASMEAFALNQSLELRNALRAALVLIALKGHERDSILSLALSLAGRQLGDLRLSGILISADLLAEDVLTLVRKMASNVSETTSIEDLAEAISQALSKQLSKQKSSR